jgi:hypothetical protein
MEPSRVGAPRSRPAEMLAHMMFGAPSEVAMTIARSLHPKKMLNEELREFGQLLEELARRP